MNLRLLSIAIVALVAVWVVGWWLALNERSDVPSPETQAAYDYVLTDYRIQRIGEDGRLILELSGPRLAQLAATERIEITSPVFTIEPAGANWRGRAESAELLRDVDELVLRGNVILTHPHQRGEVRVESEQVHYLANRRTAFSPGLARVTQAGTELSGGTLSVHLDQQRIEFANEVQGLYRDDSDEPGSDARPDSG